MAAGARRVMKADIGVGITGIAGPGGGTAAKPVGLVYVATATARSGSVRRFRFAGGRAAVRGRAVKAALAMMGSAAGGNKHHGKEDQRRQ
jgi:PncC family amidohydrolase